MEWNLYSSPHWVPFYYYTMFQNPMHKKKINIITQKVLVTQSSNMVHCNWHTQKPICADMQAFLNTFPCSNWCFFIFCQGELRKQPKFTFCWFWLGKMHQNGFSGVYLGFEACRIQCQNQNFRQKFHILLILTGKNDLKWLEWHIFRVWSMPTPMALVLSLYNKLFLKNHNFRKQVA